MPKPGEEPLSLGARPLAGGGVHFTVWAPGADAVHVAGTWNGFSDSMDALASDGSGTFAGDIAAAKVGDEYRYLLAHGSDTLTRNDTRTRAASASGSSIIVDPRAHPPAAFTMPAPDDQVLYELHVGTFSGTTSGTFTTALDRLDHLEALGVNVIELMPIHEFGGKSSWGYNPALPFAVARAYGTPAEFAAFVDAAHARNIAVIVDVVHNHYSGKSLVCYDGDCPSSTLQYGIYFYGDADRKTTPWGPRPNYGKAEVAQYIIDNALMWLDEYGADGMRWDSVSNIRGINNGGADNPEGRAFLTQMTAAVHQRFPKALLVAEDLATIDLVTDQGSGGLGFDAQWDAAFFHPIEDNAIPTNDSDRNMSSLEYALTHRYNDRALARVVYSESHDEVANGRARIPEMIAPGDAGSLAARKRSTLAAAIVMTAPGVPMLFQGQEFLEDGSFSDQNPLDWQKADTYAGILALYTDLVHLRRNTAGHTAGLRGDKLNVFHVNDGAKVIAYHRFSNGGAGDDVIVLANFSATSFGEYKLGLPRAGSWHVRLNSDDKKYSTDFGGTAQGDVATVAEARDDFAQYGSVKLAPYSVLVLSQ